MKTLVTGAGGFIGSAVVRALLAEGRAVRATLAPGESSANVDGLDVERVTVDVCDRAAVAAHEARLHARPRWALSAA